MGIEALGKLCYNPSKEVTQFRGTAAHPEKVDATKKERRKKKKNVEKPVQQTVCFSQMSGWVNCLCG